MAQDLCHDVVLGSPLGADALRAAETALGRDLPLVLALLLSDCDGIQHEYGTDVIWSTKRLQEENLRLRSDQSLGDLYAGHGEVLFIGDNGWDDRFALVADGSVFAWVAETGEWVFAAPDLEAYVRIAMRDEGDWYRTGG
ncbi:SMI1/KNR4 family protein [Streptacidiphilus sp. MAP12-33]|uniref:SMI1/KNR4 family protein n=1 Tax=Streptacidiphilus sp. MAP12-33 TaxID=3156266 RepID=UPI003514CB0C